ncbi:MAG: hypothetical protein LBW77_06685 [Verrucomicrobiota bacterium]|jgi:hypothetical protein|nr:hypothetical protein [Verrucomicrobiota bacterium]
MKNALALLATATLALTGCQTTPETGCRQTAPTPPKAPAPVAYAALPSAAQQAAIAAELRTIGTAIQAYSSKHGGQWPARLSALVSEGLLPAAALVSVSDPTGGREGGVPDSYDTWQQSTEADEPACSFLYEFSGATAAWGWKTYLAGAPSAAALDTDKNGEVSWQEAKLWQLAYGDTAQTSPAAYAKARFPVVRCYWYGYPASKDDTALRSVVSLAADLKTVFLSQPWWEKDTERVLISD